MPATEQQVALPSRYRVVRHIASGGMASVWAAEDELLGRLVAVKLLSRAYDCDERARTRFLREARAAARLGDCRHVVTVYDIGEHEDRAFMVMEHFAGGSVADRLRSGAAIPRALAVRWLREAAIALDCAHEHEVVHRDVKPANLLLDQRDRLAVGDFGIATVASEASVTQTGQVLGTAAYLSPEQARGLSATAASDRYALAVVAFELITGARPFAADHPAAQARAHVEATVPAASGVVTGLPRAVDAVFRSGMAKDPDARPGSAEELVDLLEEALGGTADDPTAATRRFFPLAGTPGPGATAVPAAASHAPAPTPTPAPAPARRAAAARSPRIPSHRPATESGRPPVQRTPHRAAWIGALAALVLATGAVVAIAVTAGTGGGTRASTSTGQRNASSAGTSSDRTRSARTTATSASTGATSTPTQPTQPAQTTPAPAAANAGPRALNDQGFALIRQGNPAAAVTPLQQSVQSFRAEGRTGEIEYAFALFNLGNALRMSGRPAEAIPLLEERLRVSNYKRGVVARELALARRQAGAPSTGQRGRGSHGGGGGGGGD